MQAELSYISQIPLPTVLERSYTLDKLFSDDFLVRVPSIAPQAIKARQDFLHMSYEEQIIDSYILDNENLFLLKLKNIPTFNHILLEQMITLCIKNNNIYPKKLIYLNKFKIDVNRCLKEATNL